MKEKLKQPNKKHSLQLFTDSWSKFKLIMVSKTKSLKNTKNEPLNLTSSNLEPNKLEKIKANKLTHSNYFNNCLEIERKLVRGKKTLKLKTLAETKVTLPSTNHHLIK